MAQFVDIKIFSLPSEPPNSRLSCVKNGFTILEIMLAASLASIFFVFMMQSYFQYVEKTRVTSAIADIKNIEMAIENYYIENGNTYPPTLGDAGIDKLDPWGKPYQYLNIKDGKTPGLKGKMRKDKNLVPINSDYDLYSSGKDGNSVSPLTAKASRDDIVRANNGAFIGIAVDY